MTKVVPGKHRRWLCLQRDTLCALALFSFLLGSGVMAQVPSRVPNTTLRMPLEPANYGYRTVSVFPNFRFTNAVAIKSPPGETNRLFVIERAGRIVVITNLANPTRTIFMDISPQVDSDYDRSFAEGMASLAFHPGYATNRYFYVVYTLITNSVMGNGKHNRIARYQTAATNPNQGNTNSELPLITQRDEGDGHNWNDLFFGPDGYLYVALGDEGDGGGFDFWNNSQKIDKDYFSGVIRIDVDKRPGNLLPNPHPARTTNYFVPSDNPFVGATSFNGLAVNPSNVRTEFWAVGIRNPWRMSIDMPTGNIYVGDVGQHNREEINLIVRGGNYGWAYFEGDRVARTNPPAGFSSIPPLFKYQHGYFATNEGKAVIGGLVYRGSRMPELNGAYIFTDYVSGNLWALRHNGNSPTELKWLMPEAGTAGFGMDPRNGDLLLADNEEGEIHRLEYGTTNGTALPPTLADTGIFSDLTSLNPHPGIIPYDLNVPFWSDNATKKRWFSVPDLSATLGFSRDGNWSFPAGTVWVKHFELQLTNGTAPKRIETRVLVRNNGGVYGATYRWGNSTANATLVAQDGLDEIFVINESGVIRTQLWRYPGRNACLSCHTPGGGLALGFNTPQLNRFRTYGNITNHQIAALSQAGYFSNNASIENLQTLRVAHPFTESSVSLEHRVRSYLAVNCAQCHHPGGPGRGTWDARITTPLSESGLINGLLIDAGGNPNNRVIKPNSLSQSMLLTRISTLGSQHMPPLATSLLDTEAILYVQNWITNGLAGYKTFSEWTSFYGLTGNNALPEADPDFDGAGNRLEYLLGRNPTNELDGWKIRIQQIENRKQIIYPQIANRGFEVEFATNIIPPVFWEPLNVPGNALYLSSKNRTATVEDNSNSGNFRFYRVRVYEP